MSVTEKPKRAARKPRAPAPKDLRLDLAAGQRPTEGFLGVDAKPGPGIDYVVDLFQAGWPWPDNSVAEVVCNHFVEHIPHYRPEYQGVDGWWVFFNELYRVCQPDAKLTFTHPFVWNDRAFWDPTHTRYIHSVTWHYLSRAWREMQGLGHYDATCDFEMVVTSVTGVATTVAGRSQEHQDYAVEHYKNVYPDLIVELKALKPEAG